MRAIEEIEADMDRAQGCMLNRHDCDGQCVKCDYLNYDKYYFKLKEENYRWYQDQDKRKSAIIGIETNRLETICAAEKEGRCIVLRCKAGDTVYFIGTQNYTEKAVFGIEIEDLLYPIVFRTYEFTFDNSEIGKTVFLTRSAAEAVLKEDKP